MGDIFNYDEREYDSDYYTQPGKLWRLMSAEDQKATCENTARAMADAATFIKQRHIRNCFRADPTYGKGVAAALGLSLQEALIAEDPATAYAGYNGRFWDQNHHVRAKYKKPQ